MAEVEKSTPDKLRAAAAHLFWEKGYAATTTRELGEELGMNKASLYYHMQSKEDLLFDLCIESLNNIIASVREAVSEVDDPMKRVQALIKGHVSAMLKDKDKHATMLTELRSLSSEKRLEVIHLRDEYEILVRTILGEAQENGALRDDISAKYLSLCLLDLLNWAIFWYQSDRGLTGDELANTFTTLFIDGSAKR